ncbi:thioester domain-containing protein [Paraclostridium bifermentans]|uniref:thioester domain-containing protein n=1 Tax=Paraclostridium bifermentans TaxID=1490 RepID=UPI00189741A5|nr:thioester domain-containing protein [Paraclostridium bifermentans]
MKICKKIFITLLVILLNFNTVMALEGATRVEYFGKVKYSYYTVGKFKVNGQWAFCVDHAKPTPPTGSPYGEGSIYNNESIKAILYYGFDGPGNAIGNSDASLVATSLALDSIMNNNHASGRNTVPGYSVLMEHAQKKDAPSSNASFSKNSVDSNVSGNKQVSETITFNADYRNSINLPVNSGTTIVVDGHSYTSGVVTIKGGQSFYVTAPLDYTNDVIYENIKPNMKTYSPIIFMPTNSGLQRLSKNLDTDPVPVQRLSIDFKARKRNVTVLHKDRHDGSLLLQENNEQDIGSNYSYSPKNPLNKDGRTYIPESTNSQTGNMPNEDLTFTFWYNLQRNITVQHIDARDGSLITQETEKKLRGQNYSYSPRTDLKRGNSTYRPVSNEVQSGKVGNDDITIKFYYDVPLIQTGLKKIQIYTDLASKGLPVKVELDKKFIYDESVADMAKEKVKLSLYDGNNAVATKEYTAKTLPEKFDMTIPSTNLNKDSKKAYTLKIEGYNKNAVDVIQNADSLTTDGYSASQKTIKVDSSKEKQLDYKAVVMTEREVGKSMNVYYETLNIPLEKIKKMRTGYGFKMPIDLTYTNGIGASDLDFKLAMKVPDKLVDKSYIEYESKDNTSTVNLEKTHNDSSTNNNTTTSKQKFELQHVNVEKRTGHLFSSEQVKNKDERIKYDLISGDRKFYLPIWGRIGDYKVKVESTKEIGINRFNVELDYDVNVYAHMYAHMDSETISDDAIILEPVNADDPFPNGTPKGWSNEDVKALKEMLGEKLNKGNLSMSTLFPKK